MADEPTDTTATATSATTSGETADAPATPVAADAGATADATVLGEAATDAGTGDTQADSTASPTPTPMPDDAGVPDAYELKLTTTNEAGEETAIDLDPVLVEAATPLLKEAGLSNEAANKLLPLIPQVQEQMLKQQNDEFAKVRADWAKQAQADPEIGGKNWAETQLLAAKALDHFGARSEKDDKGAETNDFRKLLNESGLGNHPVMLKMFRNIGSAVSEDPTFVRNTNETESRLSREQKNYPEDQPKA